MSKITFKDLENANMQLQKQDIDGEKYTPVSERILAFRKLFPCGRILTEWKSLTEEEAICVAHIFDEEGTELAHATAKEIKSSSDVNLTSYVENCETSAVGRALGFLGIGVDDRTNVCSLDEATRALSQQGKNPISVTPAEKQASTMTAEEKLKTMTVVEALNHIGKDDRLKGFKGLKFSVFISGKNGGGIKNPAKSKELLVQIANNFCEEDKIAAKVILQNLQSGNLGFKKIPQSAQATVQPKTSSEPIAPVAQSAQKPLEQTAPQEQPKQVQKPVLSKPSVKLSEVETFDISDDDLPF